VTTPATEIKSIGLLADASAGWRIMVFATPSWQFYIGGTTSYHLPGLSHLDNFIWTRKLASVYRDFAKTHANPDTDGNSPYHRAVRRQSCETTSPSSLEKLSWQLNFQWSSNPWLLTYQISSRHDNFHPFTRTLPSWQFHHDMTFAARLPGL
jgi:hypothetical protein